MKLNNLIVVVIGFVFIQFFYIIFSANAQNLPPSGSLKANPVNPALTNLLKGCLGSIELEQEEKDFIESVFPVVKDPFCCLKFGKEKFDCLVLKANEIYNLLVWLEKTIQSKVWETWGVCEPQLTPWGEYYQCSYIKKYDTNDPNGSIEKALKAVQCSLKNLDVLINGKLSIMFEKIQECIEKSKK